jgi:hypothetical protein
MLFMRLFMTTYLSKYEDYKDEEDKSLTHPGFSFFNPWANDNNEDGYHNWTDLTSSDRDKLIEQVQLILKQDEYINADNWLLIWLPLRQEEHKTEKDKEDGIELKWIINEFINKDKLDYLDSEKTQSELASLLPLLCNIRNFRYWQQDLDKLKFEIKLLPESKRRTESITPDCLESMQGKITCINDDGTTWKLVYSGLELLCQERELDQIKNDEKFPEKFRTIKAHIAIIFIKAEIYSHPQQKSLPIKTAVFLPLNECENTGTYSLILHGYFFVDSARTRIVGQNSNSFLPQINGNENESDKLKIDWNQKLQENQLRKIPEALNCGSATKICGIRP